METHSIAGGGLRATISQHGAELCALADDRGRHVLWPGHDPWPRHAPNLFPIVGRLKHDRLRHAGRDYRMTQHGFARDRAFTWLDATPTACRLELRDDAASRAIYPFAFRLEIAYAIDGDTLAITFSIDNPGDTVLPASFGAHPAFRWPLVDGIAKDAHMLEFAADEPSPIRRVAAGLLLAERLPTPIQGRTLPLHDGLFAHDAIILDTPASRWVRYSAPGAPVVKVSWDAGFPHLGIWARPDAALLCIEPWHGMSSPEAFDGDFIDKPGLMLIPPGASRQATHSIAIA